MTFHILTLFPDLVESYFRTSIAAKAVEAKKLSYNIVNIRDFTQDKHRSCDDYPYGGGAGMVLKPEPLSGAFDSIGGLERRVVFLTPSGRLFNQEYAQALAGEEELILLCGRYEGVDQRIIDIYVNDEISLGDYVMSSGEVAALAVIDSIYRLLEGVINADSLLEESFVQGMLEYPHYTRPREFRGYTVPDILISGHHERIRQWRTEKSLEKTRKNRPEILDEAILPENGNLTNNETKHGGNKNGSDKSDRN